LHLDYQIKIVIKTHEQYDSQIKLTQLFNHENIDEFEAAVYN